MPFPTPRGPSAAVGVPFLFVVLPSFALFCVLCLLSGLLSLYLRASYVVKGLGVVHFEWGHVYFTVRLLHGRVRLATSSFFLLRYYSRVLGVTLRPRGFLVYASLVYVRGRFYYRTIFFRLYVYRRLDCLLFRLLSMFYRGL